VISRANHHTTQEDTMPTLHIEHPISDFGVWSAAYDRFAEQRRASGVTHERVSRPAGDERYVIIDLDFAEHGQAESFLAFLEGQIWSSPANSPALAGKPRTSILDVALDR
jgi:hypothetical protein